MKNAIAYVVIYRASGVLYWEKTLLIPTLKEAEEIAFRLEKKDCKTRLYNAAQLKAMGMPIGLVA